MSFTSPLLTDTFPKKAAAAASYYGFTPVPEHLRRYGMQKRVRVALPPHMRRDPFAGDMHALFGACAERGAIQKDSGPLFLYDINNQCDNTTFCEHPRKAVRITLAALGLEKSIAEAVVLHTAAAILDDVGVTTYRVYVNGIGDKDSIAKYTRDAHNYLRKHINDMPVSLQTALKRDIFLALEQIVSKPHPLRDSLPRPMQYLTDPSRRHLKEVIEYLEGTEIPYTIDDLLLGHKDYYTKTVFEMRVARDEEDEELTVARGGRFEDVTRRFFRFPVPGAGIVIEGGTPRRTPTLKTPVKRPKVCLVNIGFGAKRQSLPLIETLRKARIPLHQSLGSDHLGDQLEYAATVGAPYALIIGQREALDNTVIVRDMSNQSQQTIRIDLLPSHLQQLHI